jgi:hypothetical protein
MITREKDGPVIERSLKAKSLVKFRRYMYAWHKEIYTIPM